MSIEFIPTKIIMPRRPAGLVRRQRLVEYLHENLGRKLLLVTAPAGYGKTTLLVDFASDVDFPVCWYTLDEADRDPATFMAHLVASIRLKFPEFGKRSGSLPEQGVVSARAAAAALVADMTSDVPEYFVLIFDDWHLVTGEAAIAGLLDQLLRYLPEHAHLVVAGRALPKGPLVRMAAQRAVAGLGPGDLRFNASEVQELLASRLDLQITQEQAEKLVTDSEGWITGILLTSQRAWRGLLSGLIRTAGAAGSLYDYLAGEVLEHLSDSLCRFLMESAVPSQFTIALCDDLRGLPESETWIEQVEANNLFLSRIVVEGETWFRYHQLFREFLLERFKRDDPAGLARLKLRSGELLESRQQPEEAVEQYLAAGAPERAARVMDRLARGLALAGRTQTLLRWADLLPAELHATTPELDLFQGRALTERGRAAEALVVLDQAAIGFQMLGNVPGQIRAALEKGWTYHAQGRLREALATGEQVLREMRETNVDEPLWEAHALRLVGVVYGYMGQWLQAEEYLAKALALHRHSLSDERRTHDLGRVLHDLAYVLRFMGRLDEAAALQAESLSLWREIGNPKLLADGLNNVGYDRFLAGDYEGALTLYAEALAKAEEAEDKRGQAYLLEGVAAAHRDRGEFRRAIEIYDDVFTVAHSIGDQALVSWALDGLGHAYRLADDLDRALALFEQARSLAVREEIGSQVVLSTASIGITRVEQGNVVEGIENLERASSSLRSSNSYLDLMRALFWLARAYYEQGNTASARDTLTELVRLGNRLGCRPFSLAEGRRAFSFLTWGVQQLDGDNRLQAWLDGLRLDSFQPQVTLVEPPPQPRIEVRALGSGRVLRDGRPVAIQEWSGSALARELLFYLLEHSPQTKEKIGVIFWPDLSPARMTSAFHAAKYKARHALGVEFVVYADEAYQIDPAAGIWHDVAEFERLLDSARRLSDDPTQQMNELQQAVALYTGDYLTDVYSDWAVERRRILQVRYFEALNRLIALLLSSQQYDQALELARHGLEVDAFREDLHRAVMRCLAAIGRQGDAIAHYEAMFRHLQQELGVQPEPESIALAEQIRPRRTN